MKILAISGSTRKASLNTWLLQAIEEYFPKGVQFELITPTHIPLYNEDDDGEVKPDEVEKLLEHIKHADGIIFASPEYNHGTTGALKNLIDWASRPAFQSPLLSKPCGILTASKSPVGGARAQADLKNILSSTLSLVYPSVEFLVPLAHEKFSQAGKLEDAQTKQRLQKYAEGFLSWLKNNN